MQNNKNNNRPAAKPAVAETKKDCCCDSSCNCGCKSKGDLSVNSLVNIIGAILILFGTVSIALSVTDLSDKINRIAADQNMVAMRDAKGGAVAGPAGEEAFKDFVKNNPKFIIDSLNAFYQKQQAAQEEPTPTVADKDLVDSILNDKTNHVLGNPKGSFVIIEFFDYNCGYCKMMNKKLPEAIKKSKNIRWVLMDSPIFGERSELIARYAFAAAKQGKFAEYHAALGEADNKDEASLKEIGKKLGLKVDKLEKDANSDAAKAKLAANKEYAKKLNINGVPMFIVNGEIRVGAFSDDQLNEYVKQANEMK